MPSGYIRVVIDEKQAGSDVVGLAVGWAMHTIGKRAQR